jgi:hypothetical protein
MDNKKKLTFNYLIVILMFVCIITQCSKAFDNNTTDSFFPLVLGSVWVYDEYMEGELQNGQSIKDSVAQVTKMDSITRVAVYRFSESDEIEKMYYDIIKGGMVFYKEKAEEKGEPYCMLNPQKSSSVGDMKYSDFLDEKKIKIRLETSDYENARQEEQMEWQGKIFVRGIGIVSFGGSEIGYNLREYRIGAKGPRIRHKKD